LCWTEGEEGTAKAGVQAADAGKQVKQPCLLDGSSIDLSNFVESGDVCRYLASMSSSGVFGDYIALLGMACLFNNNTTCLTDSI